ncbi:MAG: hypothetical protein ACOX0D_03435 [Sphaerochaeta sp.]
MKKSTRCLIVLLIIAMVMFVGCDDTLTHDMNDDVEVDEDEQVVATRTVTWMNYDGKVLKTAEVEKGQAPDHPDDLNPTPPASTYRLEFDPDTGNITVTEDIVYQYKFKEWYSRDQYNNYKDQVFTATYDTYGPGSESQPDGELADLTDFRFSAGRVRSFLLHNRIYGNR